MREQLQLYNEKCFIRGWYLNSNICDTLIEYFERSNHKFAGSTSTGINKKIAGIPIVLNAFLVFE